MVDPAVELDATKAALELDATKAALEALQALDQEQVARALRWLSEILKVSPPPLISMPPSDPTSAVPYAPMLSPGVVPPMMSAVPYNVTGAPYPSYPQGGIGDLSSPKAFLASKRPKSLSEKIACLAYYLTHCRNVHHFKTADIISLNTEAAQPKKMQNPSRDVAKAETRNGYLVSAGAGNRQISTLGEAIVAALPDRDAVEAAAKDHNPVRRRKPVAKKRSTTSHGGSSGAAAKSAVGSEAAKSSASGLAKP